MIFITVGTQVPFDRLIEAVDKVAINFPNEKFIAQALGGQYKPKNIELISFLSPSEFDSYLRTADLIIGHAGIGTIITALTNNKPLLVLPRRLDLAEHTTNHQTGTAEKFSQLGYARVMQDEAELAAEVSKLLSSKDFKPLRTVGPWASQGLLDALMTDISDHERKIKGRLLK